MPYTGIDASRHRGNTMTAQNDQPSSIQDTQKAALNKRLESIGWGLFLIMIGGIWLVPDEQVPEGTWLIGAGLIMLGLNLARYLNGIRMSGFTIVLGILALASGLSDLDRKSTRLNSSHS